MHYFIRVSRLILTALLIPPWFDLSSCLLACKSVLSQTTAKQLFIPIRQTQVIHTVLKEGLWVHSGVASTKWSCRSKQHATEVIRCKFSCHGRVAHWTELTVFRAICSRWWKWPGRCKDGNNTCKAVFVICINSTDVSTQATHFSMGGGNHDLYQIRPSISDNNLCVYNNTSQQARMQYCYVIHLDRKTPQNTINLENSNVKVTIKSHSTVFVNVQLLTFTFPKCFISNEIFTPWTLR